MLVPFSVRVNIMPTPNTPALSSLSVHSTMAVRTPSSTPTTAVLLITTVGGIPSRTASVSPNTRCITSGEYGMYSDPVLVDIAMCSISPMGCSAARVDNRASTCGFSNIIATQP